MSRAVEYLGPIDNEILITVEVTLGLDHHVRIFSVLEFLLCLEQCDIWSSEWSIPHNISDALACNLNKVVFILSASWEDTFFKYEAIEQKSSEDILAQRIIHNFPMA